MARKKGSTDDPNLKDADGRTRLYLTEQEKKSIRRKKMAAQAAEMIMNSPATMDSIAKEVGEDPKAIVAYATQGGDDGVLLRRAMSERISEQFNDITKHIPRAVMASELGLTKMQFDHLVASEEFREIWAAKRRAITSDPNISVVQEAIVEHLLPQAYTALARVLGEGSGAAQLKAALEVMRLSGIKPIEQHQDDRAAGAEFLEQKGININAENVTVSIPPEFLAAFQKISTGHIIDAEAKDA